MYQTAKICNSHKEMKADEYRYWQSRPVWERMDAVSALTTVLYEMKTGGAIVQRLEGPLVVVSSFLCKRRFARCLFLARHP